MQGSLEVQFSTYIVLPRDNLTVNGGCYLLTLGTESRLVDLGALMEVLMKVTMATITSRGDASLADGGYNRGVGSELLKLEGATKVKRNLRLTVSHRAEAATFGADLPPHRVEQ
jgi:hypothetical protein